MLCEIKKKEKQQFGGKFGIRLSQPLKKKIWSNSCTIPQIKYHKNYCHNWIPDFYEEKKIILFLSTTSWLYPKNIANWEWCYYYCVFFCTPFPFFVSNSPPTYYPPLLCITTANQKIGSQYSQLQKWVDSFSFKKKGVWIKKHSQKKYQNNHN